jgi:hypothetical protein
VAVADGATLANVVEVSTSSTGGLSLHSTVDP